VNLIFDCSASFHSIAVLCGKEGMAILLMELGVASALWPQDMVYTAEILLYACTYSMWHTDTAV
jgi:hypothetical protein